MSAGGASTETFVGNRVMKKYLLVAIQYLALLVSSCGRDAGTADLFTGGTVGGGVGDVPGATEEASASLTPGDTLVNCEFNRPSDHPFGQVPFDVYGGALQIDNRPGRAPAVLLSEAGLLRDGMIQARFNLVEAPLHTVVGLVLRASDRNNFVLMGVNSRGQYTVQECRNGLWYTVMGLESFEASRLLPYSPPWVELTAVVHGSYVDFSVNGQLVQVVRLRMPALGAAGVFVDEGIRVELDRFTVIPDL